MTTIQEYTDAIEVAGEIRNKVKNNSIHFNKSTEGKQLYADLKTIIDHLKANRWERVKQLAEQPENQSHTNIKK